MEAAESLAGFAILVKKGVSSKKWTHIDDMSSLSIGSFLLGLFVLIAFFVMTSNIGSITKLNRNMEFRQVGIQSSLDKIVRLMEKEAKDRAEANKIPFNP